MWMKEYYENKKNEISFPLGGIGSGCIGLGGDGRFKEWEIFNRPNKGGLNGFSHLAVKAEKDGKVLDARVLHTDLKAPFTGEMNKESWVGFGHGPYRQTMAGIPHFEDGKFCAAYPFAKLVFSDKRFPGQVTLSAFNPLIPLREDDSSLPAAFFEIEIRNIHDSDLTYTIAFSLGSPFEQETATHQMLTDEKGTYVLISRNDCEKEKLNYGELCVATDEKNISVQRYWYRGRWYSNLSVFWQNFTAPGKLEDREYHGKVSGSDSCIKDTATLAAHVFVKQGETRKIRFVVSWYFPVCEYYLDKSRADADGNRTWKNYYAVLYPDAKAVAMDALVRWNSLEADTLRFTEAFYSQSLPEPMLDAAGSNISILKSPTVLRLEDGSFYGWEGVHCREGSCEGSCTHVWNYAYALPFLFPRLERSMRDLNYRYNQDEKGGMHFRLSLPLGTKQNSFRPCCDGQFGDIIKVYREWKLCGDTQWLKSLWPYMKKSIEYAWSSENEDKWDLDKDGVLEGRQHHTLDMELFGPNSWLTGMYLAALKAAAEMAEVLGEKASADEYLALFNKGQKHVDNHLFNGEYYIQQLNLNDRSVLEQYSDGSLSLTKDDVISAYWNEEVGEIMYQFGEGCVADQVLGQWHASMCGLGEIYDSDHVKKALASIYRYNYKNDLRLHFNPCRIYAMPDERTTLICDWPDGVKRPLIPAPYSEEGWPGIEYQVAAHMQSVGMYDEALTLVTAVRDRYDGFRRNPFNEIECGSNYARSMASYALVLAASGFKFDLPNKHMGFVPSDREENRKYFWSVDTAWGIYTQKGAHRVLRVLEGQLTLISFESDFPVGKVLLCGQEIAVTKEGNSVVFNREIILQASHELVLE